MSNEHFLWLVITELAEATEADRKEKKADLFGFNTGIRNAYQGVVRDDWFVEVYRKTIKGSVEEELADACIRLFDLAGLRDIDLDDYQYSESDTEGYSDLTFTESMLYITEKIVSGYYDDINIFCIITDALNDIFCFCKSRDIDIMFHIEQKMKFNSLRPYKHGDKKY